MRSSIPIKSNHHKLDISSLFTSIDVTVIAKTELSSSGTFPINVHPKWVSTATRPDFSVLFPVNILPVISAPISVSIDPLLSFTSDRILSSFSSLIQDTLQTG
ncbi:hypothetical protein TNCV_133251 [Trichonephila clavipes]|nr:hypothetical protein TNCV_133251 [Trichonephila clavipes]